MIVTLKNMADGAGRSGDIQKKRLILQGAGVIGDCWNYWKSGFFRHAEKPII